MFFLCLSCWKQKHLIILINVFCESTLKHKGFLWQFFSGKKTTFFNSNFQQMAFKCFKQKTYILRLLTLQYVGSLSYRFNQALLVAKRFNLLVFPPKISQVNQLLWSWGTHLGFFSFLKISFLLSQCNSFFFRRQSINRF